MWVAVSAEWLARRDSGAGDPSLCLKSGSVQDDNLIEVEAHDHDGFWRGLFSRK